MSISSISPLNPDLSETSVDQPMFFVVSTRKLIVMCIFTFGFYWMFCLYRSWALYRRVSGERVLPLVRAFFGILFLYSLLSRVDRQVRLSGRRYEWSPFWLVCVLILLTVPAVWAHWFIDLAPMPILGLLVTMDVARFWVLARMQQAMNFCVGDPEGKSNARLSPLNWAWMAVGIVVWTVIVSVFVVLLVALVLGVPVGG
ncbi:hypothetical protein D3C77_227120 [compost metagenome]